MFILAIYGMSVPEDVYNRLGEASGFFVLAIVVGATSLITNKINSKKVQEVDRKVEDTKIQVEDTKQKVETTSNQVSTVETTLTTHNGGSTIRDMLALVLERQALTDKRLERVEAKVDDHIINRNRKVRK